MRKRVRAICAVAALLVAGTITSPVLAEEPGAATEVRIALVLADLTDVRGSEQAFTADVFMLASWQDLALADPSAPTRTLDLDDVWHPTLLIYNQRSVDASLPKTVMVRPDGNVTYLQRFTGQFSVPMSLREFPRDRQDFFIWVVAPLQAGTNVKLVPDESLVALRSESLSVSDWEIGQPTLTMEAFQLAAGAPSHPGIRLTVGGTRRVTYYIIQVLIPLIAIVGMAYAVFWVAPGVVATRVGVVVTTMLTLIAYRFMLANHVPRLPYLTRLDWFMLGATVLVVLTLFAMAGTSYLFNRGQEAIVNKIDRAGRLLYPVVFALYTLIVWLR